MDSGLAGLAFDDVNWRGGGFDRLCGCAGGSRLKPLLQERVFGSGAISSDMGLMWNGLDFFRYWVPGFI